ncbi:MAG: 2-amino-4-hydroxy-6-hydroxymethyldihydropteridine diphosphokinase [Thermoguttaceae bacterium]|nr:2-amino-4-hydroxy-6-hydroxymethyldihydropteridine diphosphokinase [Thermoguttaceae bacterium]MBR4103794.1 2-amino-4-hydroxy-6-hydroxymethyldihydropteridine diphosphokinase [Thermoguttaceae bacterium]
METNALKNDGASVSALVALGSNLPSEWGAPDETLLRAVERLDAISERLTVQAVSSIWRTFPVGGPASPSGQSVFANAVAAVETTLGPFELLATLQEIEREARRVRKVFWGPRTLDLDLILFGDLILNSPTLTLPHPRAVWRDFVLGPACEIVPNWRLPTTGLTLREHRRLLGANFANFESTAFWTQAVANGATLTR